jgi:hypothetical protein
MQSKETTWEALRAIKQAGDDGITPEGFARALWPDQKRTVARIGGGGRMLHELVNQGYVEQWGCRKKARYTLTDAGASFLMEYGPNARPRARSAPAPAPLVGGDEVPWWLA